ncbi:MAG: peptidoglycan bridge formation glycyltransferase FemA/FemB family protein [Candidatus Moraniibacteriota bacterium]
MKNEVKNLEFLQFEQWRKFQESVGRKTFFIESAGFSASIVEHSLPIVGKYFYCPRGPMFFAEAKKNLKSQIPNSEENQNSISKEEMKNGLRKLIALAQKENVGWIRIEPEKAEILEIIRNIAETDGNQLKIVRAPHDMQPKQIFVLDITKDTEILLSEMKPKTRYNIRLAEKKGVAVYETWNREDKKQETRNNNQANFNEQISNNQTNRDTKYLPTGQAGKTQNINLEAFLNLTKEMAQRHGITAHPENYYRKMIETLPSEMLRIYVAQFEGKIIAANLVLFFGKTATYLHGASGNEHRNVMAPFLLQWQAILDAKKLGFEKYDFGGVKTISNRQQATDNKNKWEGITTFKLGFSPSTKTVEFPGSYDIIVNPRKYGVYRGLQRAKELMVGFRK